MQDLREMAKAAGQSMPGFTPPQGETQEQVSTAFFFFLIIYIIVFIFSVGHIFFVGTRSELICIHLIANFIMFV